MNVLKRHTVISILKVGLITSLLATFMLCGVDLFKNLDKYLSYALDAKIVLKLTLLYAPEAFLMALGPAFLFSVTYYLSMLHANNEILSILNAGISYKKVIYPCLVLAVFVSAFYFGFNERVSIPCSNKKEILSNSVLNTSSSSNNYNIALSDYYEGYIIYANQYNEANNCLYDVKLLKKTEDSHIESRIDAYKAQYSEESKQWTFYECYVYKPDKDNNMDIQYYDVLDNLNINIEPALFKNLSSEVSKMDLKLAKSYVLKMKNLNNEEYASLASSLYKRIFSCLVPFVMILIATSMNYRLKKNVLFFSIIFSLCEAVVYYVVQMITMMLATQGVIKPYLGMLIPLFVIIVITGIFSLIIKE